MKNIRVFLSENFQFLMVKFSIYLNRRVFVMLYLTIRNSHSKDSDQADLNLCWARMSEVTFPDFAVYFLCSVSFLVCQLLQLQCCVVLSFLVFHFFFFWCLRKFVLRDCNLSGLLYLHLYYLLSRTLN